MSNLKSEKRMKKKAKAVRAVVVRNKEK